MIDNYDLWRQHDSEQSRMLDRLPVCEYCGEPVQDDYYYEINDEIICSNCLNEYCRKDVSDYGG